MIIIAIKDQKTNKYGMINVIPADNLIERLIRLTFEGDNIYTRFPEDFTVYKMAEMDEETGKIKPFDSPIKLLKFEQIFKKTKIKEEEENDRQRVLQQNGGKEKISKHNVE